MEIASVEGMEHSIVGTDISHDPSVLPSLGKSPVALVAIQAVKSFAWSPDDGRSRVDDVSQPPHMVAPIHLLRAVSHAGDWVALEKTNEIRRCEGAAC